MAARAALDNGSLGSLIHNQSKESSALFSSNLNRLNFFAWSLLLLFVEFAWLLAMIDIIFVEGLLATPPGPGREAYAVSILGSGLIFTFVRSNLAWRRTRDANGHRSLLIANIASSVFYTLLQSGQALVRDFNEPSQNTGLAIIGFVVIVTWFSILWRATAETYLSNPFMGVERKHEVPKSILKPARVELKPVSNSTAGPIVRPSAGFGRRGLT